MNPSNFGFTRSFHSKLPLFKFHPLANDKLTQLFATWHFAAAHIDWFTPFASDADAVKLGCAWQRVNAYHRKKFLRAFAAAHTPAEQQKEWPFGFAKFYTTKIQPKADINYARAFRDRYAACRYWRQNIPKLP